MKVTLKRSIIAVVVLLLLVGGAGILYLRFDPARRLARHVTKARIAVNGAQYGTALTEYEAALALDPSSAIVLTEIGYVRLAMEQPDRAVRHFEESIAAEPEYIRAWTGLIRARLALGQNDAAITDAERMLKQRRDDETLVVYGNALASTGAYGNALMALEEAARLAPDKHEPVMQRAELLGQLRRNAEQREVLREYAFRESGTGRERACLVLAEAALSERRAEDALALTTRGIGIKATPELAIRRAEALLQLGRFADGRAAIDELVADGNPSPNLPAAAYKVRAGCLLELNDVQGALRDAQQAARALPDDADVALTLARIHYKDGRAMQAQEECNRALSLSPDHTAAQNYLMLMLLDRKHYEQAIAFGRTLLDRRRNEVALRMLVRAYLAAGRPDDALKDLKPSPTSPAAGRVITPLPGNDSELERLQKLNEKERNNATVQFLLGQAYLRSRNLQQCMRCLARAAELEPGRLEVEFSLAQIRLALGQGDSAAAGLEKIVEKHPEHAAARLLLVQVHLQQKALPKAAAALKPMILSDGLNAHTLSMLLQTYESDADLLAWMTIADELLKSERVVRQADAHVLKGIVATLSTVTNDSLSRAEHHYKQALTLAPAHRIALHQKAINDLRTGRDDDATAALRKLDASQLAPDAHERMDLAVALLKIQAFSEARAVAFEEYALRRTPETLLALVAVELASGRHEEAAKLLEKTPQAGFELLALSRLARAPRASELFSKLAQSDLFARNKRESWALECLDQAQALAPESEDLAAIRAKALFTFGRKSDDAASALEKAFAADQKRADFAMLLADMRRAQNKLDEAVKLYRHVLESRPNEYRALVMAGTLLMNGSEKHAAADFLKQAIKLAPTDVVSLNNYVWLTAVEMNRPQAALPYAQDLARLAPDNPSALDTAGWVFHLNGQHEEAIKVLEYAALLAPESGDIAAHHALALHKAGRMKEAKTELERARQLKRSVVTEQDLQAATTVISAAN